MPRKKKEEVQLDDELEKKGKKGGKKGKTPKEPKDDMEVETITVEEAIALLAGEEKGKKKKVDKNMSIEERNKIDPDQFLFKCGRYIWVTKKVGMDSLRLNDRLTGMFAFGLASLGERTILLHETMDKEFALDTFTHEATHATLFKFPDIFEETEGGGVSPEYICELVSEEIESLWEIRESFKKSAFYKTFKDREY